MSYPDTEVTKALRSALAQQLADEGDLRSPEWRNAVEDTPRHVFVPVFYRQAQGGWEAVGAGDAGYFDAVYGNTALTTQVTDGAATSSSSMPGLMVQMLEALGVEDGDKVAEVATGTGYNGALICHRVGDENFSTMEVDAGLARLARARLGEVGHAPTVLTGDARAGFPGEHLFDRVIVTCGFDTFPYALARNVRPGGVIVCPLGWGNARLTAEADGRLEGHFLAGGSYFMKVREEGATGAVPYPGEPEAVSERAVAIDLSASRSDGFGFVQSLVLGAIGEATELDALGRPNGYRVWSRDGSWAHVQDGLVRQGGPRALWDSVEHAHSWFAAHGSPERERFGVTVTPEGQGFWLDEPGQVVPTGRI
ncbi:protein-L-isoaspartate(D-aspartate) O-methyltransferase [Streptomyces sp. A1277]|uniref:protein-L-isoaspartate(D-aspartate) O-methyltransferase n=1 Tax=Streptomyces sp. A1277 TaxID=2563103 RepID=UPI001446D612|nr:protein-L-isoaspartate(D-aspartate) O-methyltransferase [Streptomyces sp. A1277]